MSDLLPKLYRLNAMTLFANLDGVTAEQALVTPPGGGNSINWIVGHLVHTRNGLLDILGAERLWAKGEADCYARGAADVDPSELRPLDDLTRDFKATKAPLDAAIRSFDHAALDADGPHEFPGGFKTVREAIAFLHFHESYHVGQIGFMRRIVGLPGAIA